MLKSTELMPWTRARAVPYGVRGFEYPLEAVRDIERLFDELWRGVDYPLMKRLEPRYGFMTPKIDLAEDEKEVRVYAELPGMEEDDIEVSVGENIVTIKGEKRVEKEGKEKEYAFRERAFGSFYREIPLNVDIMADKVEATFENGLLTVTLPKTVEMREKFRKIPVHAVYGAKRVEKKAA